MSRILLNLVFLLMAIGIIFVGEELFYILFAMGILSGGFLILLKREKRDGSEYNK